MLRRSLGLAAAALLCLIAPPAASAQRFVTEGEFGTFTDPRALAVDDAGRVYVADAGAGRVYVYDRAQDGNRLVREIGEGVLKRPTGVAVDNRGRVYVADAERDVIELYESASDRFARRGTLSGPGTSPGELDEPYALTTDPTQRVYVVERGSLRVSIFRPARRLGITFQTAFGIALPEPFRRPSAVARDSEGRLFVADGEADGGHVRVFDRRGRYVSMIASGNVLAPQGVAVDRFDRLLVADTGNDRIQVLAPLPDGSGPTDVLPGLNAPRAVSFAPGSLVYVLEPGRIVRLRFDDADVDGVPDEGDNCRGLANPLQANSDKDANGDSCDADDDDDGKGDAEDRCPTEAALAKDLDGCLDPISRFLQPGEGKSVPRGPTLRIVGRSEGGELGVAFAEVALARRLDSRDVLSTSARCSWLNPKARAFTSGPCTRPQFFRASGRSSWRVRIPKGLLPKGRYVAVARAQQKEGPLEARRARGRNVRSFTVR
jgi:DNA-binding beta-propeller fold protein YncE